MLATEAGLLGLSGGISGDIRDLEQAADSGSADAQLALDVYVAEIRRQLGGMLVALGGCDALVFTGGIGENAASIRAAVCADSSELGIRPRCNPRMPVPAAAKSRLDADQQPSQIWIIPTNEELIVARQTVAALTGQ